MEENYYEKLQINEKASPEIIKKVYNVFVKKYHPDLWPEDKKAWAEEEMKKINEAYETLINEEKRKAYDEELASLKRSTVSNQQYEYNENIVNEESVNNTYAYTQNEQSQDEFVQEDEYTQEIQQRIEQEFREKAEREYNEAYNNYLRSLGYKIKYKRTFREYLNGVLAILIMIIISFILWKIPFTNRYLRDIYESNGLIKVTVDTILKIFGVI